VQVVNKARVNEMADESALLAQYKREIAQLRAALLEGRGGMIITADVSVTACVHAPPPFWLHPHPRTCTAECRARW